MTENKKPKIRFKKYITDWNLCEVNELLQERNKQTPKNQEYPLMAFVQNEGVTPKGERYDRSSLVTDTEKKLYKQTEYGDFIYSSNNLETGSIGLNKYGKACISPVYSIFSTTALADPDFIGRRFIRKDFINEMVRWRQGVVYGQWRIHETDFLKIKVVVPNLEEQFQIGQFLDKIDKLIALYQHKHTKLITLKKTCLEKMFPIKNETKPQIRFSGFDDHWEKCELSEIATIKARIGWQGLTKQEYLDSGNYYLITGTDFNNGSINWKKCHFVTKDRYMQDLNIQIKNDDVLITKDGTIGKVAYVSGLNKPATLNSGVFVIRGDDRINNLYLYHYLAAPYLLDYTYKQATGGTIKHLNQNVLVKFNVPFPSIDEQIKIGKYFSNLDNIIKLNSQKIEKLKNIKASLLEKMFA